jgi:hypothetical protein
METINACASFKRQEKLPYTVGVEFTFIAGGFDKGEIDIEDYARAMRDPFRALLKRRETQHDRVTVDPDCIEIPSKIIESRKEFKSVAKAMHEVAGALNMIGHTDWHGGGGAHIHVGFGCKYDAHSYADSLKENTTVQKLLLDATHRPYINWAFTNPADTEGTKPATGVLNDSMDNVDIPYLEHSINEYARYMKDYRKEAAIVLCNLRARKIKLSEARQEYNPNNAYEHELHLDFVLAYLAHVDKYETLPEALFIERSEMKNHFTAQGCKDSFMAFVSEIGLDAKKYKRYLKNIDRRFNAVDHDGNITLDYVR